MIKYLIIDDEPIAHRIIEGYAKHLAQLSKAGNCYSGLEALGVLHNESIDLIFLDINMPQLNGFELLRTLSTPPKVIVTSAYQEFALEGYELNVVDYLLKPFSFERFLTAVNKIQTSTKETGTEKTAVPIQESIFLKQDRKQRKVWLDHIRYIEAYGNYCKVHLNEEVLITPERISALELLLPQKSFLRIHKSFIVAIDYIEAISGNKIQIGNKFVPIGQTYANTIKRLLKRD